MHRIGLWFHGLFFHSWHFLYQQIQLTNWVGNIVAGVVTFIILTICWPRFRHLVERAIGIKGLHDKLDTQHDERLRQAEVHQVATHALMKKHYHAQVDLAKAHHDFHVAAATPVKQTQPRDAKGHFVRTTP